MEKERHTSSSRFANNRHSKKSASAQEKKDAVKQLFDELKRGTESFRSSESWLEYLSLQSKLPDYSYNNCVLIGLQTKGKATLCMGYEAWKKVGRHVKAGETALRIICPAPRKVYVEEEKKDVNGNPVLDKNGNVVKEKKEQVIQGYRVGYTFDIAQTEGKPLPEICRRIEGGIESSQRIIEAIIRVSPVPISFEDINGGANGFYVPSEKRIVIKEDLSPNHTIHTLLHEITHATLHLNGTDEGASRGLKEVEAESTAFVVMKHMLEEFGEDLSGEDLGRYSFAYINSWSSTGDLTEMQTAMRTIQKTSITLIESLDRELYGMEMEEVKSVAYRMEDMGEEKGVGYLYMLRGEELDEFIYLKMDSEMGVTEKGSITLEGEKNRRIDEVSKEVLRRIGMASGTCQINDSNRMEHPENLLRIAALTSAGRRGYDSSEGRIGQSSKATAGRR